jgi:hypothetical protein
VITVWIAVLVAGAIAAKRLAMNARNAPVPAAAKR